MLTYGCVYAGYMLTIEGLDSCGFGVTPTAPVPDAAGKCPSDYYVYKQGCYDAVTRKFVPTPGSSPSCMSRTISTPATPPCTTGESAAPITVDPTNGSCPSGYTLVDMCIGQNAPKTCHRSDVSTVVAWTAPPCPKTSDTQPPVVATSFWTRVAGFWTQHKTVILIVGGVGLTSGIVGAVLARR